jgi:triacylglycerol lipase
MPFNPKATNFSAANALLLAEASEVAYQTETDARTLMANRGLPNFAWIDLSGIFDDLHAFAASNDQFAVVAFRGTADVKDWMTDLYATPVRFSWIFQGGPEAGDIHAGFGHALCDGWLKVTAAVRQMAPQPAVMDNSSIDAQRTLWITGHSLGGALAALTGAAFSLLPGDLIRPISGIYTFGQPRIGLHNFCANYDRLLTPRTFRVVNNRDLVPRVPFRGWDYSDVGEMIHFTSNGVPERESLQWRSFLARTLESFQQAAEIFTNLNMDVGDHNMSNYRQLVANHQDALDALFEGQEGAG